MRLRKLFEFVGDHFGIAVEVITTDGRQPIGNGIGPVLEAAGRHGGPEQRPRRPGDLREKSLRLAAHVLENDPQLRGGSGYARARELLDSGAALKKMQKIIDAQGPRSAAPTSASSTPTSSQPRTEKSQTSIACDSTAWPGRRVRRSTRVPASNCSRKSATALRRASRSIGSMRSTSPNSTLPSQLQSRTPAIRWSIGAPRTRTGS